jgi:hypothetical protein
MPSQVYKCNNCNLEFDYEEDAIRCEKRHQNNLEELAVEVSKAVQKFIDAGGVLTFERYKLVEKPPKYEWETMMRLEEEKVWAILNPNFILNKENGELAFTYPFDSDMVYKSE